MGVLPQPSVELEDGLSEVFHEYFK